MASVEDLPPYEGAAADLFDDSFAPEVFGFKVDRPNVLDDSIFQRRVAGADQIQQVRLRTIQQGKMGQVVRYGLVLSPVGSALAGPAMTPEFELPIHRASPSLNLIRSMDVDLVGKHFIVLVKTFRLADETVLHFRAEPDSESIRAAIVKLRSAPPPSDEPL